MKLRANCKINIGLNILRKREDGYHDLDTVMYPVRELYDEIEIEKSGELQFMNEGIAVDCPVEKNLCYKAWKLFHDQYNIGNVRLVLRKNVPFGAGLGGGSSDATMTLIALNELYGLELSEEQLIEEASKLGSDTAFFVKNTPQLCQGRGEIMTPVSLPQLSGKWLLLVKPEEAVSTREAYTGITPVVPEKSLGELLKVPVEEWNGSVVNDFEKNVFASHPLLGKIKKDLNQMGAEYSAMSGSGSTMFGIFSRKPDISGFDDEYFVHLEKL